MAVLAVCLSRGCWRVLRSFAAGPPCHAINAQGRPNSRDELRQQSRPRLLGGAVPLRGVVRAWVMAPR